MIRLIAGKYRGRRLEAPDTKTTRPTTDRVRESIFNLLDSYFASAGMTFDGLCVLDAFAGSGALGLESLSRGAGHITFFEQNPMAYSTLLRNMRSLEDDSLHMKSYRCDATKSPKAIHAVDLVFLDPPYRKNLIVHCIRSLQKRGWIKETTLFLAETGDDEDLCASLSGISQSLLFDRTYGSTKVNLFTI